jgi:hypothetical protein
VTQNKKDQRKERVLHTRVSEKLDSELREKAAGLGVSVSNLVRNILLNTVEMVEDIVADGSSIARAAGKNKPEPAAEAVTSEILGWQTLTLNLNAICAGCNAVLAKGTSAAMAVCAHASEPIFRCADCLPTDDNDAPQPKKSEEQA